MNPLPFLKGSGLGNDFVIVRAQDGWDSLSPERAARLADRRTGIGCDQVLWLLPAANAQAQMLVFNADGGAAGFCGNGLRAVMGAYILGLWGEPVDHPRILAAGQILEGWAGREGAIACTLPPVVVKGCDAVAANTFTDVDLGNPHAVFIGDDLPDLETLAAPLNGHPRYPEGVNVKRVARVWEERGALHAEVRICERGVGETPACGSGATAVAAVVGQGRPVTIHMPGGGLHFSPASAGGWVMEGAVAFPFSGVWRG